MFIQAATADTFKFMIYGFVVILGTMSIYLASLVVRFRNLARDIHVLKGVASEK
jgi:hypothetical protein